MDERTYGYFPAERITEQVFQDAQRQGMIQTKREIIDGKFLAKWRGTMPQALGAPLWTGTQGEAREKRRDRTFFQNVEPKQPAGSSGGAIARLGVAFFGVRPTVVSPAEGGLPDWAVLAVSSAIAVAAAALTLL